MAELHGQRPIRVGDLARLPARIRANPDISPALREQMGAFEDEVMRQPGRVVSIHDSWAMVEIPGYGRFGCPVEDLELVEKGRDTGV